MRFIAMLFLGVMLAAGGLMAQEAGSGWMGVELRDLTAKEARALGRKAPHGAMVVKLVSGGPAETAGLRAGDVLVSLDGAVIEEAARLAAALAGKTAGTAVKLTVRRPARKPREVSVMLGARPAAFATPKNENKSLPLPDEADAQKKPKIEIVPDIGHGLSVSKAAFSPDGARVLTGSSDKNVKLWDVNTGKLLRTFQDTDDVSTFSFSPDGSRIFSANGDNVLRLWDTATGKVLHSFKGTVYVYTASFSPNGARIISGGSSETGRTETTLTLWDTATGKVLGTLGKHSGTITSVVFSPDGAHVLSGSEDKTVKLWDAATGQLEKTFHGHSKPVISVAFSPDGASVLSFSNSEIILSDTSTGKALHTIAAAKKQPAAKKAAGGEDDDEIEFSEAMFSPDGVHIFSYGTNGLELWDAASGQFLRSLKTETKITTHFAVSPDGTRIFSQLKGDLALWDIASGQVQRTFKGDSDSVGGIAYSADGTRVVSAGGDLKVWDVVHGQLLRTLKGHDGIVTSAAFSRDGTRIVSGGEDDAVKLWDVASGQLLRTFEGHSGDVETVAFSPDGKRVASGSEDTTLRLWDAETGKLLRTIKAHQDGTRAVAFSPNGSRLLSGGDDNLLRLWDATSGKLLRTMKGHESDIYGVAFSPDGSTLLSGSWDATLKLWNAANGKLLRTLGRSSGRSGDYGPSGSIDSVAFSPDGTRVASADSGQKTVRLWDVKSGELLHTLRGHSDWVRSVAFSPEGTHLLSGGWDSSVIVWDVASGAQLVSLFGTRDDEWLAMTPAGFFANSAKGPELLTIVRGNEPFSVMQFYDHLHRPDLVEEALKGDPEGKYKDAAGRLNLKTILGSGPAPRIELLPNRTEKSGSTVKLAVRIIDASGGIGSKVVWRVNGTTQGDTTAPGLGSEPYPGHYVVMPQTLNVDPAKKNEVEITAYNHKGLLATTPYRFTIDPFGVTKEERPRLFVLAVGVNDYLKPDWRLRYAANDASALGAALKAVGSPLFADVDVTTLLDTVATERGIDAAFDRLAWKIKPRDVFILYLGGHGRSITGSGWFFVPQDLNLEAHQTIEANGIGQDKWQRWLAKIAASKSVVILDACEAGATEAFRGGDRERETVMSQLEYATGRNIIAATPSGKAAYEGYRGHGVLTYAVLDALNKPEGAGEETVDVYGLAAHVSRQVMEISLREFGVRQKPEPILHDNFPLGVRKPVLEAAAGTADAASKPSGPTHIVMRPVHVRQKPADDAPAGPELKKNTLVTVKQRDGAWALVERGGETIGYVPADALEEAN